ncbi:hypothetical protein TIFTF001_017329 [Ficus carica]|uniref:Uncharacterized protein n=1 Tax=Ficus carica TaxID=3494 RepID=A0AA88AKZ9_FICCA|nr:hypothetical protein TIFTF001_017329 [Ficus carica]
MARGDDGNSHVVADELGVQAFRPELLDLDNRFTDVALKVRQTLTQFTAMAAQADPIDGRKDPSK